jgi:predicted DNA-binding transcriptional regulator YafY
MDHSRQESRTFRVDRMSAVEVAGPELSFVAPVAAEAALVVDQAPWRFGADEVGVAEVWVDQVLGGEVSAQLGPEAVIETRPDGSVVVRLGVANVGAFRSWVLGLLDHAVVLGPPELRQAVTGWLTAMAG